MRVLKDKVPPPFSPSIRFFLPIIITIWLIVILIFIFIFITFNILILVILTFLVRIFIIFLIVILFFLFLWWFQIWINYHFLFLSSFNSLNLFINLWFYRLDFHFVLHLIFLILHYSLYRSFSLVHFFFLSTIKLRTVTNDMLCWFILIFIDFLIIKSFQFLLSHSCLFFLTHKHMCRQSSLILLELSCILFICVYLLWYWVVLVLLNLTHIKKR